MAATFENVAKEFLKQLVGYFQIITCVITQKQLFASGSLNIVKYWW